jgi:BASS family bile acid:Na+ symporter
MTADQIQTLTVQSLNITLMFSVGLELDLVEFRRTLGRHRLLGAMLLINFGLIPAVTFGAVKLLSMPQAIGAGLLLSAFAPGGGTGSMLTRIAHGSLELSVALLGALTLCAVAFTPLLTQATLSAAAAELQLGGLLRTLLLFQLLPLCLGIALHARAPKVAEIAHKISSPTANVTFFALIGGLIVTKGELILQFDGVIVAAMMVLIVMSLALPIMLSDDTRQRAALSLTTGVRNLSLALLLTTTYFEDVTTVTVLAYGLFMYLIAIPVAFGFRRKIDAD